MAFNVNAVPLTSGDTIISELGVSVNGSVHGLVICNNTNIERSFTLKLYDSSEDITSVFWTSTVPANSQFTWPKAINLEAGDALIGVGPDLIALQSTYVGVAIPAAQGFTGRGAWSSIATYQPNDVVSYDNNSYVANTENTNSTPPSADWTLLAAQGEPGDLPGLIRTPTAISPTTGGLNIPPIGPLVADAYGAVYSSDVRDYRRFEVAAAADTTFSSPVFTEDVDANSTFIDPILTPGVNYIWRCKDVSITGDESEWMTTQAFTTLNLSVVTPTVSVTGSPSSVGPNPTITLSAYATTPDPSSTYLSTDWEVRKQSDNSLVFSSYNDQVNVSSISVPPGILLVNTTYIFRGRYNSTLYGSSAYGTLTATTLSAFVNTLYDPLDAFQSYTVGNSSTLNTIAVMDTSTSVFAYAPAIFNQTATVNRPLYLRIINTDTATQTLTSSDSSAVLVATNVSTQDRAFSICALTATSGLVVWHDYYEGTGSGLCYVRKFVITGGVLSLVGSQVQFSSAGSATRNYTPFIWRQSDSTAVVFVSRQTATASNQYVITASADTPTVGTAQQMLTSTDVAFQPFFAVARNATQFVYAGMRGSSSGRYIEFGLATISGNAISATSSVLSGAGSGGQPTWTPAIVMLTSGRCLIKYMNPVNSTGRASSFNVTDTTITQASSTDYADPIPISSYQQTRGFFRINDTQAMFVYSTGLVVYNYTSDSVALTNSSGISLTNIGVGYCNYYQLITSIGYLPTAEYFIRGSTSTNTSASFNIDRLNFATQLPTNGTRNQIISYGLPIGPYNPPSMPYYEVLSKTRAVAVHIVPITNPTASHYAYEFILLDISGSVPTIIFKQQIAKGAPSTTGAYYALSAFTASQMLFYDESTCFVYSVTDTAFTLLAQTQSLTDLVGGRTQPPSFARLDNTRILMVGMGQPSTVTLDQLPFATVLTFNGTTISVGPVTAATSVKQATNNSTYVSVEAASSSRALITWVNASSVNMFGAILNIVGDVITVATSPVQLSTGGTTAVARWFVKALDSTRYLVNRRLSTTTAFFVVQDGGGTLTFGSEATMNYPDVAFNRVAFTVLAPDKGLILIQQASPDAVTLYPFTVGTGTATPSIGTAISTVVPTAGVGNNYYIDLQLVNDLSTGAVNELTALVIIDDQKINAPVSLGYNKVRKFLRGTS